MLRKDPVEVPADKLRKTGLHGRVVEQWVPPITLDRAQLHGNTNTAARGVGGGQSAEGLKQALSSEQCEH